MEIFYMLIAQTSWSRMTDAYIYLLKPVLELAPTDQQSLTTRMLVAHRHCVLFGKLHLSHTFVGQSY